MGILIVNAGSSSLKVTLFDAEARATHATGSIDWADPGRRAELVIRPSSGPEIRSGCGAADHRSAAAQMIRALVEAVPAPAVTVIGHRIVHGGSTFGEAVLIEDGVKAGIARLAELAPLHNPAALEAIEAAAEVLPAVPQVAAFDTAFYRHLPRAAFVYPLPYSWYSEWGIRRFGFHGLSHAYCAGRAAELLGRDQECLRIISLHLGNGCSATAVRGGVAVETTMGFTPMDGLMMGSRSGSVDPGILIHAQRHGGLSLDALDHALNHESGLKGVSAVSSDFRAVAAAARAGDGRALLALEIYANRVRSAVGALTVALGGVDALVFTAGVGENQPELRAAACRGLECLGIHLDDGLNATCRPDADVAAPGSTARVLVIHTREELMIAREALRLVPDHKPDASGRWYGHHVQGNR